MDQDEPRIIVVASDGVPVDVDGLKRVETLGANEDKVGTTLREVFAAVTSAVVGTLSSEATLTIELDASAEIKASGGAKWILLNVGGSAKSTATVKIKLETTVKPVPVPRSLAAGHPPGPGSELPAADGSPPQ